MGLIIRADRCELCKFREPDIQNHGLFLCHRFPPQQTFVGVAVPVGPGKFKVEVQRMAAPVQVQPAYWCGEFRPLIEKVN